MNVKTQKAAMVITLDFTDAEFATLARVAERNGLTLEELIKAEVLSSCGGVNTPKEAEAVSA